MKHHGAAGVGYEQFLGLATLDESVPGDIQSTPMSKVRIGFHRLGLFLSIPCVLFGAVMVGLAKTMSTDPSTSMFFGISALVIVVVLYALSWGLGWVLEGFLIEPVIAQRPSKALPMMPRQEPQFDLVPQVVEGYSEGPRATIALQMRQSELKGIGGWLLLPAIGTYLTPFLVMSSIASEFDVLQKVGNNTVFYKAIASEIVFLILLLFGSVYVAVMLKTKSYLYPLSFISMCVGTLLIHLASANILIHVFMLPWSSLDWKDIARSTGICIVWSPYMLFSKRVRNTFVN